MNVLSAGYITAKDLLPVSKVNFGRTHSKHSSGRFTLGKFECSGTQPFQGMPSSCEDLRRIGHHLSGFYTVKVDGKLKKLYCDMSKLLGDKGDFIFQLLTLNAFNNTWNNFQKNTDLEKVVDSVNVIQFHVKTKRSLSETGEVSFDVIKQNVGNAFNIGNGIFIAPIAGIYFFNLTAS